MYELADSTFYLRIKIGLGGLGHFRVLANYIEVVKRNGWWCWARQKGDREPQSTEPAAHFPFGSGVAVVPQSSRPAVRRADL